MHPSAGTDPPQQPVATGEDAVRPPLPGGWTAAARGAEPRPVTGALVERGEAA